MYKAYKYRLYPNKEQEIYFMKCFGCVRFIYNKMLSDRIDYYKETNKKLNNTPAQYKKEFEWLKEVDSLALANAQMNLNTAYNNFFKRPNVGFPKFKSKKNNRFSYTTNNQGENIRISGKYIKLPKIGLVKVKKHRDFQGVIKSVTISKTPSGKYYASVLVDEVNNMQLEPNENAVGIDLGKVHFAITSDGEMIDNPKYYVKSEKKLAKLQKELSRKKKGSKNMDKARIKVAKQHERIANQRKDFLHKLSKRMIKENQLIVLEDLDVKALKETNIKEANKSTSDVGWGMFRDMITYKSEWYNRQVVFVDRYYPSSQICSVCGHRDGKKSLDIRDWVCPKCNTILDRDINASINILREGLRMITVGTTGIA